MSPNPDQFVSVDLLQRLQAAAGEVESVNRWPAQQLHWLAQAGVLGWVIPQEFGGSDVSAVDLMRGYQSLAQACLTTTFVLTQRNGACSRLAGCDNDFLKSEFLPELAQGNLFATVGISHLSTSRQHWKQPTVRATLSGGRYRLDGEVPWVTGAPRADLIVTGGSLADGRQVLIALSTNRPGITVGPPVELLALSSSQTATVRLDAVDVEERFLVAGPIERVMQSRAGGTGSLATSALALGLAARALSAMQVETELRADLAPIVSRFQSEYDSCQERFASALAGEETDEVTCSHELVRESANSLVLRITQAWLAASKGAGFVAGHPAERAVREAMFFLVWSCPRPVIEANLRELSCFES